VKLEFKSVVNELGQGLEKLGLKNVLKLQSSPCQSVLGLALIVVFVEGQWEFRAGLPQGLGTGSSEFLLGECSKV